MTEEERFMSFVAQEPNTGCWLWAGSGDKGGYGGFRRSSDNGGKWERAHRVSYRLFVGPIPEGKILDHLCRVRCCVNPNHLEPVTYQENAQRGETGINKASATHCPNGHPYYGDNLYLSPNGKRGCKKCRTLAAQKHREKKID